MLEIWLARGRDGLLSFFYSKQYEGRVIEKPSGAYFKHKITLSI
jgi:hypothetical protein